MSLPGDTNTTSQPAKQTHAHHCYPLPLPLTLTTNLSNCSRTCCGRNIKPVSRLITVNASKLSRMPAAAHKHTHTHTNTSLALSRSLCSTAHEHVASRPQGSTQLAAAEFELGVGVRSDLALCVLLCCSVVLCCCCCLPDDDDDCRRCRCLSLSPSRSLSLSLLLLLGLRLFACNYNISSQKWLPGISQFRLRLVAG